MKNIKKIFLIFAIIFTSVGANFANVVAREPDDGDNGVVSEKVYVKYDSNNQSVQTRTISAGVDQNGTIVSLGLSAESSMANGNMAIRIYDTNNGDARPSKCSEVGKQVFIFKILGGGKTTSCFGFSVGDSWNDLVNKMSGFASSLGGSAEATNNRGDVSVSAKTQQAQEQAKEIVKNSKGRKCFWLVYKANTTGVGSREETTGNYCLEVDDQGNIIKSTTLYSEVEDKANINNVITISQPNRNNLSVTYYSGQGKVAKTQDYGFGTWQGLLENIAKDASTIGWTNTVSGYTTNYDFVYVKDSDGWTSENITFVENDDNGGEVTGGGEEASDPCSDASASLGWMLCPILTKVGETLDKLYDNVIEGFLVVEPKLLDTSTGTYTAWGYMVGIANTLLVILLLVVIFSQLTGVGIDNYGIKKILPRIILVAILINLSFIICQLLVDLSNILGASLQDMFQNLSVAPPQPLQMEGQTVADLSSATSSNASWFKGIFDVISIGAAGIGVVSVVSSIAAGNLLSGIIVPVLLAFLVALIAVLFFFILLGVRKAGVVVLIVVAPLACVCYMLPNTKKYFDKWWKAFSGLLLVYPICGLVIGGGNFASRLILSVSGDYLTYFTGAMLLVVPFFFVPVLLKGSFAALGNIGAKISGLGKSLGKGATGKIKNTDGYKNMQRIKGENMNRFKAGRDKNGNLTARGRLKSRFAGTKVGGVLGYDRLQASRFAADDKTQEVNTAAEAALINSVAASEIATKYNGDAEKYYKNRLTQAAQKGDASGIKAAIKAAVSSGRMKDKDIAKMTRSILGNQNTLKVGNEKGERTKLLNDLSNEYGNGFLATDFEQRHWMQNGGKINQFNLSGQVVGKADGGISANYDGAYARNNIDLDDIKPEDGLKLSGDSLAAMIVSGKLTPDIAQQILAKNPNISGDKRIMLSACAEDMIGNRVVDAALFKKDAQKLYSNPSSGVNSSGVFASVNDVKVREWTAPTPQKVNVVP